MPRVVLAAMNAVELFDLELRVLLEAVFQRYHYDFRDYAVSSLRRRMRHAMARFDCARVADLQHRLLHEPDT
ncbi:protein-glutamate O-methyltransferase CheR, partial [Xanthomonas perforans]|nr:protein-glutamate O-methyltransferase CheR [Xanthomonas perforans]